jgi:vancomycin resistance protein YoaR
MNRRTLLLAGLPLGLLAVLVAVYGLNRVLTQDVVGRNVMVGGVLVSGLTLDEARVEVGYHADLLTGIQIPVIAAGEVGEVSPVSLGLDVDTAAAATAAFAVGRGDGFFGDLASWMRRLGTPEELELPVIVDDEVFEAGLGHLDRTLIGRPAFDGDVELVDGRPVARYPRSGTEVHRDSAREVLVAAFVATSRAPVELDVQDRPALVTDAEVDRAVEEARRLLTGSVVLVAADDRQLVLDEADLAAAFVVEFSDGSPVRMVAGFDEAVLKTKVDPQLGALTTAPVNARFDLDRDAFTATIRPGRPGTTVDLDALAAAVHEAATAPDRRGTLPLEDNAQPAVTTAYLEGLGIKHLVARFTTYHPGGEDRVTNIHRIADLTRLAIVDPGQRFDLNAHVGRRTPENGFVQAGGILGGEILNDIYGGGVSQFATTLYNAVFWGGYEDVRHKPHSFYFSRYPMGIEATLDYDSVPLVFRNDSDKGILINTAYSETAITVEIWGDNDGRVVAGNHRDGVTSTRVLAEGGPGARRVTAEVSEPIDLREPTEELIGNPEVTPGTRRPIEGGFAGFRVNIRRVIEQAGRSSTQNWTWTYDMKPSRWEVHPCDLPGGQACPEPTTTTTVPPSTTTTTPPDETTTTEGDG